MSVMLFSVVSLAGSHAAPHEGKSYPSILGAGTLTTSSKGMKKGQTYRHTYHLEVKKEHLGNTHMGKLGTGCQVCTLMVLSQCHYDTELLIMYSVREEGRCLLVMV